MECHVTVSSVLEGGGRVTRLGKLVSLEMLRKGVGFREAGLPAGCAGRSGDAASMCRHPCLGGLSVTQLPLTQPINQPNKNPATVL